MEPSPQPSPSSGAAKASLTHVLWSLLLGRATLQSSASEQLRRAKICGFVTAIVLFVLSVLTFTRVANGLPHLAVRSLCGVGVGAITIAILRRGHVKLACHTITGGIVLLTSTTNLMSFGRVPAAFLCSSALIVLIFQMLGTRAGGLWSGILCLSVAGAALLGQTSLQPMIATPDALRTQYWYSSGVITCFTTALAALMYERLHAQTLAALSVAKQNAEAASRAKSTFLANMSHEIRTPLNGVSGIGQILLEKDLDQDSQRLVTTLNDSADTLLDVINSVLDFSKIEAGAVQLENTHFDLHGLCRSTVELMTFSPGKEAVSIELEFNEPNPYPVLGDPTRLRQVLTNLLSNALKFTESGRIVLSVNAEHPASLQGATSVHRIFFSIQDTGIGIAQDVLPRLFQSFRQADNSTTRKHGGTGLGLAISAHLVQLMGGQIEVESTPGTGSRFFFTINLSRCEMPTNLKPSQALPAKALTGHVLIVDDNAVNRMLVDKMLATLNLQTSSAVDGVDALRQCEQRRFDAILMDCQMPNMDGYACTAALRALPHYDKAPIIALTANAFAEDKKRCLDAGMDDFLAKPVQKSTLQSALGKWLPTAALPDNEACAVPTPRPVQSAPTST